MDDDIITVKNVKVRFLCTKEDKYENEITYFKLAKNMENKFTALNKVGFKVPYFETNDGKFLLKVKHKNVKINELKKDEPINCEVHFKYYKMSDFDGYYVSKLC